MPTGHPDNLGPLDDSTPLVLDTPRVLVPVVTGNAPLDWGEHPWTAEPR
ncbi:MAG: hypothetical protein ABJD68_19145 [Nakamurella sp.]